MSTSNGDDLRNERERLEIEKQRLELDRQRFEFEQKRSAATTSSPPPPLTSPSLSPRHVPLSMWVLGAAMIISCFFPWLETSGSYNFGAGGSGSLSLGTASGLSVWQGQLCMVLLIAALIAKHLQNRVVAGICALGAMLLAIQFILSSQGLFSVSSSYGGMSASASLDLGFGSIAFGILSIPFAILAFRQKVVRGAAPTEQRNSLPEVPSIPVLLIATQVLFLLLLLINMNFIILRFSFGLGALLFFAVLHWGICRKQKWPLASFWSLTFLATAAVNWISWMVGSASRDIFGGNTSSGNWLLHVAHEFSMAVSQAAPYTYFIVAIFAFLFAWSEHFQWKPKFGPLTKVVPNWINPALAGTIVLAYPLIVTTIDAIKLDIPSEAEREQTEMLLRGLTDETWTAYDPQNPSETLIFSIWLSNSDYPRKEVVFGDYGYTTVYATMLWRARRELRGKFSLDVSNLSWPDKIHFTSGNGYQPGDDEVSLSPLKNGFFQVQWTGNRPNRTPLTLTKTACPSSTYARRQSTVRSLDDMLQKHCIFLTPRNSNVNLSALSEELRIEVKKLMGEGKVFAEFPIEVQSKIVKENSEQSIQGVGLSMRPSDTEPVAIAKEILLAQDTIGTAGYAYESIPSPRWVGLTDSTISIDHQIRFIAFSRDGSGELHVLRSYRSVFDTASVLLSSIEVDSWVEQVWTNHKDSIYTAEGIFVSSACGDDCYLTFRISQEGTSEERSFIYAIDNETEQFILGSDDTDDPTNPDLIGKKFLLTLKLIGWHDQTGDPFGKPYWVEVVVGARRL